jgi:hypothetical protein
MFSKRKIIGEMLYRTKEKYFLAFNTIIIDLSNMSIIISFVEAKIRRLKINSAFEGMISVRRICLTRLQFKDYRLSK